MQSNVKYTKKSLCGYRIGFFSLVLKLFPWNNLYSYEHPKFLACLEFLWATIETGLNILYETSSNPWHNNLLDKHLKWTNHIQHVAYKANLVNAFLRQNISSCPPQTKKMCYLAMMHPILEYASVVWYPYTNNNIHKLEMVQHRAARFITNNYSPSVSVAKILHHLSLPTLEQWWINLKLVTMYKIVHNQVQLESRNYLIETASYTRS